LWRAIHVTEIKVPNCSGFGALPTEFRHPIKVPKFSRRFKLNLIEEVIHVVVFNGETRRQSRQQRASVPKLERLRDHLSCEILHGYQN
jgi:hypothetical protein